MKLVTVEQDGEYLLGVEVEQGIIDVSKLAGTNGMELARSITALIAGGEVALAHLQTALKALTAEEGAQCCFDQETIQYGPAITHPSKIICVGLNYRKHADETKAAYPDYPVLFNKFNNALTGHLQEIAVPRTTKRLDYEVELGIVIGKQAKNVDEAEALDHVFGYCTTNDLSARDTQKRTSQWMTGKTSDGFAPVGPFIVTKDEIADPDNLRLTTKVNGKTEQDSTTADMIFSCAEIVSYISQYMTLVPGDLIMTGTPEGVIIGRPMAERVYLQAGDEVTVEVEGLGALTNIFIADV